MMRNSRTLLTAMLGLGLASPALAGDVVVQLPAGDGFVVQDSTATERFRVDEQGRLWRSSQLILHSPEWRSLFVGTNAGNSSTGESNTGLGVAALFYNSSGNLNTAVGKSAMYWNDTGSQNSALGLSALYNNQSGGNNSTFGYQSLMSNVIGSRNSAYGSFSLLHTESSDNTGFGYTTLSSNVSGSQNSAFGVGALASNNSQHNNTGVGFFSLFRNSTGERNSAFGALTLEAAGVGDDNTAVGFRSLTALAAGSDNIAVGANSGLQLTSGNDNIYIGNTGAAADSGKIKIGNGAHTETFIEGIDGNTATGGLAVLINSSNELHTLVSSIRFKEAVRDMGEASDALMQLRPVTFRYREEVAAGGDSPEYGLIAEEVAAVAPELVAYDDEGRPYSVRYHVLPSLLLNEMQKQQRTIEGQAGVIERQHQVIATLSDRLDAVEQALAAAPTGTNR